MPTEKQAAPGARIEVRDAEWLVRRVDRTSTGGRQLTCVGISQLVKNKEAIFLDEIDDIQLLQPEKTQLIMDTSGSYKASMLYMESLLRQTAPTDQKLHVGHKAAMDVVPFQLDPARKALQQSRQRILIADAVGLGKTMEAGILVSELIKRGKGKRILVVTVKSMLTQFQKEFWTRFTIPLTRLDSIGIQRIRNRIPTNHNPFYYYDKSIISIDTLKQDSQYRVHLENAYWDIIIIDEAHNVADRGTGALRHKLARLLAHRSDTLILLSATPHDGKARSFAGLMNMLDPTAIANPDSYCKDDIKGLFIRRFKKDIKNQVTDTFRERKISVARSNASQKEESLFTLFTQMTFTAIDSRRRKRNGAFAAPLFKTTLEKALFSSPAACIETVGNRLKRLEKETDNEQIQKDILLLNSLHQELRKIESNDFSKYQQLLTVIRDKQYGFGWTGNDTADRLVIFAERLETLRFLKNQLMADLRLKEKQIDMLCGDMGDIEQQRVVEAFGKEDTPVRLLLASDVASEGINLHFLCHRMIHFDIPWSLMVFQQRNGRIDRYGQKLNPEIVYLVTDSQNDKIKGDTRILEVLIDKDEQAAKNIGDPSVFMKVCDIIEEERITTEAIESGKEAAVFESSLDAGAEQNDVWALLMGDEPLQTGNDEEITANHGLSLFEDDYAFLKAGIEFYKQNAVLQAFFDDQQKQVDITLNQELIQRFRFLPGELFRKEKDIMVNNVFSLAAHKAIIKKEIEAARKEESAWPGIHYLWELNPVLQWVGDMVSTAFGRLQAPVIILPEVIADEEVCFIVSALIPNRKSHPLLHYWTGITFKNGEFVRVEHFEEVIERTGLGKTVFPNRGVQQVPGILTELLPQAIDKIRSWMEVERKKFEEDINEKLTLQLNELERLKKRQFVQLELDFDGTGQSSLQDDSPKKKKQREIDRIFDEYLTWVEDTMTTERDPYIQVVAVLTGGSDEVTVI